MAVHTKLDLFQMQSLPLDAKIRMTVRRITDFIEYHDAYISISGGKDSRVLDDIESRFIGAGLPRVFVDTGLEHRSVRACGQHGAYQRQHAYAAYGNGYTEGISDAGEVRAAHGRIQRGSKRVLPSIQTITEKAQLAYAQQI